MVPSKFWIVLSVLYGCFQIVGVFLWYASTPSDGLAGWANFYKELSSSGKLSVVM